MSANEQQLTFFREWMKHPLQMASVLPSGRPLARMMVSAMPAKASCVVELGAGTGVITEALLHHGVSPSQLLVLEMNATLHGVLRRRFPQAQVLCADARHVSELAQRTGVLAPAGADAILSSLGLLAMPPEVQRDIVAAAFAVLRPGGVFVQYTYGWRSPLDEQVRRQLRLRCTRVGMVWRNLPPAHVYVYVRDDE
ncbi:class I SAM-dependent methyltransferase [Dyella mobilis]|uniref:Methyltransferase domain-containing protein n=1 Tax=Dyella mobilis TaxID=1849582 RepID=A0ABS2KMF1_9GAMM|nr:methyltransferase domain-containing protein [Dyella mobilis]MBM7132332.1 methyltransferase domain-containing protein [Dyella mobilis]GLQ95680.1 SAM-dependent methyltransferase [Dyella mobilis]